jgi:anti-anti-sigma regulatory factor
MAFSLHLFSSRVADFTMTLKIEKVSDGRKTVIRLSGRLQSEHLDEFKTQIKSDPSPIALDLDGVTLVDVEVVRFLNTCRRNDVELLHCSPYIREWMLREQDRKE